MRYHLNEEQQQVQDVVRAFLTARYAHDDRATILAADGWSRDIWRSFATELGILGLTYPEDAGGLGGDAIDALAVMDAMGEALVVEPFFETCIVGAALLKRAGTARASTLMANAVDGVARFALAAEEPRSRYSLTDVATTAVAEGGGYRLTGRKSVVVGAPAATHLLVSARIEGEDGLGIFVAAADAVGVDRRDGRTIDGKSASEIAFSGCVLAADDLLVPPSQGAIVMETVADEAIAALCAEAVGVMRRLIRDTVVHLEQRQQFGSALIEFQALQHRLADMYVRLELSQAMAFFAADAVSLPSPARAVAISSAKAYIGGALREVAQEAVQLHGAIGLTDELAIGHLFKRATVIEQQFGSNDFHVGRVQRLGLPVESMAKA